MNEPTVFWGWSIRGVNGIAKMMRTELDAATPLGPEHIKALRTEIASLSAILEAMQERCCEKTAQGD